MNLLVFITIIPTVILGRYIYEADKKEKEPRGLLFKLFIGGGVAVLLALNITDSVELFLPSLYKESNNLFMLLASNVIGVALIEEFSKWLFLLVCTWKNKNFNYRFDAIVYSTFCALGFAVLENVFYILGYNLPFYTIILRCLISLPAHFFFGVFMGYYYGRAKNSKKERILFMLLAILVPTIIHGLYDFFLSMDIMMILFIGLVVLLYYKALNKVDELARTDRKIKE